MKDRFTTILVLALLGLIVGQGLMAADAAKLNLGSRYIRLPGYGQEGHKTLGNLYTTLLNVCGNPIKHYGEFDLGLNKYRIDQTGPIKQFLS